MKSKKFIYLLSFLIPFGILIGCCIYFGVQPFGDKSLLIIDGLHQYMPFFSVLYDKLKEGESLFYSFRAGLGINFLSLFSYYLSSPLNLLILLFQKSQLNMAVSFLIVLKISLSGLTAGIYFSSKTKQPGISVLMISLAYALNSYMVGYCWNVMWLDAIMIFPIIMLGIERLIEKRDGRLYCGALFYALYCNYYIAFMICIFAVIWYLFYSFRSVKQFFCRGIVFAFYSFLAAGMSCILLLPAYLGIKQTASGETTAVLPAHEWLTGFADLLTRQFDMASPISHDNFDGNANLFFGIFTILAAILYFLNREIRIIPKIKKLVLILFFYLSFNETILNFIWHGFHDQYGIPNRFSFLYGFVLLTMVFEVFEHREAMRGWQPVLSCLLGAGLLVLSRNYAKTPLEDSMYGIAGMLMLFYTLMLFSLSIDRKHEKYYRLIFCGAAILEMGITSVIGFDTNGQISISKFFYGTEDMAEATSRQKDGTFFRSELASALMVDENAWYDLNAVGLFGSTATDHVVKMMDSLGFYTGCNEYLYKGATPITNLLLGVKYLYYHPEDELKTDFSYVDTIGDFDIYENTTKGLSVGYMMNETIGDWYYESAYPFRVLNDLCYQGYGMTDIFTNITVEDPVTNGCTASRTNDGEYYFEYENGQSDNMIFTIPIEETTNHFYLYYDGTQVENTQIAVDGQIVQSGDVDGYVLPVGTVNAGSVMTVSFELKGETSTGYVRLSAAQLNENQYRQLAAQMTSQSFSVEEMSANHLAGNVVAGENQLLYFSIPYDEGWNVTVDGESVKTERIGDAFLAVKVSPGYHTVSLTFTPPGFSVGWKVSVLCVGIFVMLCVTAPWYRKKREEIETEKKRKKEEKKEKERQIAMQKEEEEFLAFAEERQTDKEEKEREARKE